MKLKSFVLALFTLLAFSLSAQTNHKVIFEDDFSNTSNPNEWFVGKSEFLDAKIKNGVYKIKNIRKEKKSSAWSFVKPNMTKDDNYIIEFDVKHNTGIESWGYGLIFNRNGDANKHFKFVISGNQYRYMSGYWSSKFQNLRKWKQKKDVIKPSGQWNRIKVVRTKNVIDCYVNDVLIATYGKYVHFGPHFGISIDNTGIEIEVDNFRITTFDYETNFVEGAFDKLEKQVLPFNTKINEKYVYVTADGNTMYVTRQDGNKKSNIFVTQKENDSWSDLKKLPFPINNNGHNSIISTSSDQNTLYLMNTYKPDGSSDKSGISVANKGKNGWEVPKTIKVKNLVNKNKFVSYFFTSDNKILLVAVQPNEEDHDEQAIFVCFRNDDGTYTEPLDLGPTINTLGMDFNPFLAPDTKTLFFFSTGHPGLGSADAWVSRRLDDTWQNWSEPQNLGPAINTDKFELAISLDAKGDYAYIATYDPPLPGAKGESDILKIEMPIGAKPNPSILVYGKVLNKKTNEPISASINYFDLTTGKEYGTAISDVETGEYKIVLPQGVNYGFKSEAPGYVSISENLDASNLDKYTEIEKDLYLVPIEIGQTIRLNNLFFDTGEYKLKESSNSELKNLLKLLNNNPTMKIEITGHTDNVGSNSNNMTLSKNRANAVYNWLKENNVDVSKIKAVGKGETDPIADNSTAKGRQQNRRVEFTILEK
ncbi:MAG: OmpA family protein [Chlorobiota bacterium]